jgi:hypothetical protein
MELTIRFAFRSPFEGLHITDSGKQVPAIDRQTPRAVLQATARQTIDQGRRWQLAFTPFDQARHHDLIRSKSDHDLISFLGHDAGSRFALTRPSGVRLTH